MQKIEKSACPDRWAEIAAKWRLHTEEGRILTHEDAASELVRISKYYKVEWSLAVL